MSVSYIYFWTCFFHFYENDINILIGVAMNFYLALGSVEMSTLLNLQSMSMICLLIPCTLFHSVWCVVFTVLIMALWRPCVPPSLTSESVVEGWLHEEMQCPSLPPHLFSYDVSAQAHWALCPYLSPQVEHLLGISPRSECWNCCFSVPRAHEYLGCVHEPRKYLQMNHQIRLAKSSAEAVGLHSTGLKVLYFPGLETKERSWSRQRYQRV